MKLVDQVLSGCCGLYIQPLLSIIHAYAWDSHMDIDMKRKFQRNCLPDLHTYQLLTLNDINPKTLLALILTDRKRQSLNFFGRTDYTPLKNILIHLHQLSAKWPYFINDERKIIMFNYVYLTLSTVSCWFSHTPNWKEWQIFAFHSPPDNIPEIDEHCKRFNLGP